MKQVARAPQKHCIDGIDGFVPSKIINKCQICQLTQNLFLQTNKKKQSFAGKGQDGKLQYLR